MRHCPTCGETFGAEQRFCPTDGAALEGSAEVTTTLPGDDALLGRILDERYRVDERIGAGGMGAVYRGRHLLLDNPVAIKVLRSAIATDEAAARRFAREAKNSCRIDGPHAVRTTDFGAAEDGLLYLVMELLDGKTVGELLHAHGPLPSRRVAHIGAQVCDALEHAHDLAIVHRDLKPDNIMLVATKREPDFVKVLDFGLAKLLERADAPRGHTNPSLHSLTEVGVVFGTPEYMSPEQASGNPLDGRTDLYSLGVVLYQMLCGALPFEGKSFMQILSHHVTTTPVPPSERRPDLAIDATLERLVLQCLEKRPADRPVDAEQLGRALRKLADSLTDGAQRVSHAVAAAATIDLDASSVRSATDLVTTARELPGATAVGVGAAGPSRAGPGATPVVAAAAAAGPARQSRAPTTPNSPVGSSAAEATAHTRPPRTWGAVAVGCAIAIVAGVAGAAALLDRGDGDVAPVLASPPTTVAAERGDDGPLPDRHLPGVDSGPPRASAARSAPRATSAVTAPDRRTDGGRRRAQIRQHLEASSRARAEEKLIRQIAEAEAVLRLAPNHPRAHRLIADALIKSGDNSRACKHLAQAGDADEAVTLRRRANCSGD